MKSKKGFTIIEVVLVLAIAGLIFLMVFVALPNMQRNQRDTQRRQDYSNFYANVTNAMSNNKGTIPSSFDTKDINSTGNDPDGAAYELDVVNFGDEGFSSVTLSDTNKKVYVVKGAKCEAAARSASSALASASGTRDYAVWGYLESGAFCQSTK